MIAFCKITFAINPKDTSNLKLSEIEAIKLNYRLAFNDIQNMLEGKTVLSFKEAVFKTENAYFNNNISHAIFYRKINEFERFTTNGVLVNNLTNYSQNDSSNFKLNGLIYNLFRDTLLLIEDTIYKLKLPLNYNFEDFLGKAKWENTFVTKLLVSNQGTCRSLPYLYKILADEIGAKCWLSLAPQHIYIKNYSKKLGWYNTELTSKEFPTEGWVMASGYITLKAIQNGIFMDTLSTKQCVALCLVDLANGYNRKLNFKEQTFVLNCCNLSLKYFPANINAMLLKAETLKDVYLLNKENEIGKNTHKEMLELYLKIYNLGYREMPEQMYIDWMKSLITQKDKYINKKIVNALKNNKARK